MEGYGMPEPADVSRLDTTSTSARVGSSELLGYAIAHAGNHMENDGTLGKKIGAMQIEMIDNYVAAQGGGSEEHKAAIRAKITEAAQYKHASHHAATRYPNMSDYI
jgi:hypothetical protein